MTKYKDLFFDLDRTLWDFEINSMLTLDQMYNKNDLNIKGVSSFEEFVSAYRKINKELWAEYRLGNITKEFLSFERFNKTLKYFGIYDKDTAESLSKDYVTLSPQKTALFPYAKEVLEYLKTKSYKLHILTNGFKEVQAIKLKNSELDHFFDNVIISEDLGVKKPNPKAFELALKQANANRESSVMIGDDIETDIKGAMDYGISAIWVNFKNEKFEFQGYEEVSSLKQLEDIF